MHTAHARSRQFLRLIVQCIVIIVYEFSGSKYLDHQNRVQVIKVIHTPLLPDPHLWRGGGALIFGIYGQYMCCSDDPLFHIWRLLGPILMVLKLPNLLRFSPPPPPPSFRLSTIITLFHAPFMTTTDGNQYSRLACAIIAGTHCA